MIIKSKRSNNGRVMKLAAGGEIKECFIKENILEPKKAVVQVCFRGNISSGILELSLDEVEKIHMTIKQTKPTKIKVLKDYK